MKKVILLLSLFMFLGSSLIFSQENPQPPFSWTSNVKDGSGSGLFTSKTYDEVWLAAKKYIQLKAMLISSDKETGILTTNLDNSKWVIETTSEGVSIKIVSALIERMSNSRNRAEYKAIFQGIAVLLYGEDVLPKKGKKK